MKELVILLVLAVLVEKAVGIIKDFLPAKPKPSTLRLASLLFGFALAVVAGFGILGRLGVLSGPGNGGQLLFDQLLTGILIARGSNVIHDVLAIVERARRGE